MDEITKSLSMVPNERRQRILEARKLERDTNPIIVLERIRQEAMILEKLTNEKWAIATNESGWTATR